MYVGRFAPSPTGPLHFGSLVAAAASLVDARAARGRWVPRAAGHRRAAADDIRRGLERLGLTWDGPVLYQSLRSARYEAALQRLQASTYWCGCTRREIADSALGLAADGAQLRPRRGRRRLGPRPDPADANQAGRRRMTVVRAPSTHTSAATSVQRGR